MEGWHPEVVAQGIQVRGNHSELGRFKKSCFGGRGVLNQVLLSAGKKMSLEKLPWEPVVQMWEWAGP